MSFPQNPLSQYRSHSYYHVLAICDCTQTADALSLLTDELQWRHPTSSEVADASVYERYHKYSPKEISLTGTTQTDQLKGRYCVLIDGSADADVSITKLTSVAATAAGATINDNNTSVVLEGEITLSEPRGVTFLNTIVDACGALGIDGAQAVYVLKTFFVGHAYDEIQGDRPAEIVDVAPLKLMAVDVTGGFTERGGEYVIQYVCPQFGTPRLPQYSKSAQSIQITAGATLRETLSRLQDTIQANYTKLYDCVSNTLISSSNSPEDIKNRITKVTYRIEAAPEYDDSFKVTDQMPQLKDGVECESPANLTFEAGLSIEDAIHAIMKRCPKVQELLSRSNQPNEAPKPKISYKISPEYRSKVVETSDGVRTIAHEVVYTVYQYTEPKTVNLVSTALNGDAATQAELDRNTIVFDYIYTGKNTDILNMDIIMSHGLAYLQIATTSTSTKEANAQFPVTKTSPGDRATAVDRHSPKAQIPIFFSSSVQSSLFVNSTNSSNAIQSSYTLAKHSSLEVLESSVTIYGNPKLLNSVNTVSTSGEPITQLDTFADFTKVPSFAKINIKMPSKNDDIALLSSQVGGEDLDYARDFWFTGYYYVYGIESVFDNGEFRQNLQMLGLPDVSALSLIQDGGDSTQYDFTKRVDSCYDGQSTTTNVEQPPKQLPPAPKAPDSNYAVKQPDADTAVDQTNPDLARVKGYVKKASPEVKAAITSAAQTKGVSPSLLARIALLESSFNPNATTSRSNAAGLFQFIPSTWNGYVKQSKIPGIPAGTPSADALPKRFDPSYSALAGAQYVLDNKRTLAAGGVRDTNSPTNLYLAHFMDGRRAARVITAYEDGRGYERFVDVVPQSDVKNVQRIISANRFRPDITVDEVISFAASKMASTLTDVQPTPGVAPTTPVRPTQQITPQNRDQVMGGKTGKTGTDAIRLTRPLSPAVSTYETATSPQFFKRLPSETQQAYQARLQDFAARSSTSSTDPLTKAAAAQPSTFWKQKPNETADQYAARVDEFVTKASPPPVATPNTKKRCSS
jgi:hypothetical protein